MKIWKILAILFLLAIAFSPLGRAAITMGNNFLEIVMSPGQISNPFSIKDSLGAQLINIDTTGRMGIGSLPSEKLTIQGNAKITGILIVGSYPSDPPGSNGAIYYNTVTNKFRGFRNGAWSYL